ncbi:MsnO8 family LLM class oxidoreductase [Streptomyces tendae]|uniref:MsnO8 family LLM class oxidoreductase n=1 Tax=Streptomyces tendae TaxID=1932 RepID=UPI003D71865D
MNDIRISALEIAAIYTDRDALTALHDTAPVARELERLGYQRIWYSEHHHFAPVGTFPPAVVIAHAAAATSTIRLGSGGVLAPNHSPLSVAEEFGTLSALHPDRIDLGIGRGPGTLDEATARALRRGADPASDEDYRRDVAAILSFLAEQVAPNPLPAPWLLVSSPAGADLAGSLGLPIAFAHHIRPGNTLASVERYRSAFTPSRWCEKPQVTLSVHTVCAETEEVATWHAGPYDLFQDRVFKGVSGTLPFPAPSEAAAHLFTDEERQTLAAYKEQQAVGTPDIVVPRLRKLADETGAEELMLVTIVHDFHARLHSHKLVKENLASWAG